MALLYYIVQYTYYFLKKRLSQQKCLNLEFQTLKMQTTWNNVSQHETINSTLIGMKSNPLTKSNPFVGGGKVLQSSAEVPA